MCDPQAAATVAPALLSWWDVHGRKDLPWQRDITPYRVWVSEIMLQQTQVATVERYYVRFMQVFPDIAALADAPQDAVLHLWSGLGYYARARNLHRAAQVVLDEHAGRMPEDLDALMALPGIGRSTAGAILALAANQRQPILDGNVKRVMARVFNVPGWPGKTAVANELWAWAEHCTPHTRVANYTQAIMDLGATVCRRANPACDLCPLAGQCRALQANTVADIPGRKPKRARPRREVTALLLTRPDGSILLEQRPPEGIWGGLWGFPEVNGDDAAAAWCRQRVGLEPVRLTRHGTVSHAFSHFDLDIHPLQLELAGEPRVAMEGDGWLWYKLSQPAAVGLAAPVARLLKSLGEKP